MANDDFLNSVDFSTKRLNEQNEQICCDLIE